MHDLLDYHEALHTLITTHQPIGSLERVPLSQLCGRVLAQAVQVRFDVPAFDNSAMDGYAIHGNNHREWKIVDRIAAGDNADHLTLQPGEAARIFTGAPLPRGTTAVLMQEDVQYDHQNGRVMLSSLARDGEAIPEGLNIRRQAEALQQGATLLPEGFSLTPVAVGLLAEQGYTHVSCVRRLRVTVFASGNELVKPGKPLEAGQIYNSNSYMLAALMRLQGFLVHDGGVLPDQLQATRARLADAALTSDAIVCSGGVSVGEEDHLRTALAAVGKVTQWRLSIKPGKPFTWGSIGNCAVFMLPGNPVSSLVTLQLLALPALMRMAGVPTGQARPWCLQARADFRRQAIDPRREFLRVSLLRDADGYRARPVKLQGSAMLAGVLAADGLAEIPPNTEVKPGQLLLVYPLTGRL